MNPDHVLDAALAAVRTRADKRTIAQTLSALDASLPGLRKRIKNEAKRLSALLLTLDALNAALDAAPEMYWGGTTRIDWLIDETLNHNDGEAPSWRDRPVTPEVMDVLCQPDRLDGNYRAGTAVEGDEPPRRFRSYVDPTAIDEEDEEAYSRESIPPAFRESLSDLERAVFDESFDDTAEEVAMRLGKTAGAVRKIRSRIVSKAQERRESK